MSKVNMSSFQKERNSGGAGKLGLKRTSYNMSKTLSDNAAMHGSLRNTHMLQSCNTLIAPTKPT